MLVLYSGAVSVLQIGASVFRFVCCMDELNSRYQNITGKYQSLNCFYACVKARVHAFVIIDGCEYLSVFCTYNPHLCVLYECVLCWSYFIRIGDINLIVPTHIT